MSTPMKASPVKSSRDKIKVKQLGVTGQQVAESGIY